MDITMPEHVPTLGINIPIQIRKLFNSLLGKDATTKSVKTLLCGSNIHHMKLYIITSQYRNKKLMLKKRKLLQSN